MRRERKVPLALQDLMRQMQDSTYRILQAMDWPETVTGGGSRGPPAQEGPSSPMRSKGAQQPSGVNSCSLPSGVKALQCGWAFPRHQHTEWDVAAYIICLRLYWLMLAGAGKWGRGQQTAAVAGSGPQPMAATAA